MVFYGGDNIGLYTSIADVGAILVRLLRENMTPEPITQPEFIGLACPAEKGDFRLTLFLYNIVESGEHRSNEMQVTSAGIVKYPPLSLNLHYLLTAHSGSDLQTRAFDESRMLGKAMQVFFDNPILKKPNMLGIPDDRDEEVRIILENMNIEDVMKLWTFPNLPYKLSVSYMVGPVYIDSTRIKSVKRILSIDNAR